VRRRRPGDGDGGRAAELSHDLARAWGLDLGEPFGLSRHSLVAPAGDAAVLKLVPPEDDESNEEADALALWNGDGAVWLLRHDPGRRALLLERALPGDDLSLLPEDEATAAIVQVALRLWRPAGEPFRWIGDLVPRWLASAPGALGARARELYAGLVVGDALLVHGDLHHQNVLRSDRGWLAIDPKPMRGEPEYDVPSVLWNPLPCRLRIEHLEARLGAFAAAGLDEERIRQWTVIRGAYLQPQEAEALLALV
jgi:streptomycin 6-kinase